jgi:hypothetical protein
MWTTVNQVYSSYHGQNGWAHLASDNQWHKIVTGAPDGVSNVFALLCTAKGNARQVYVVLSGGNISEVYM